jgi:hypothetical protein
MKKPAPIKVKVGDIKVNKVGGKNTQTLTNTSTGTSTLTTGATGAITGNDNGASPAVGSGNNQNGNQSIGINNQQQVVPAPVIPGS